VDQLRETDYRRITKRPRYESPTDRCTDAMYLFRATGGAFRCLGDYRDAAA
jgi:hypothetical protein